MGCVLRYYWVKLSRLNGKRTGVILLIMQRLHEDDLVGHVLAQEPWEVLSFPAIRRIGSRARITNHAHLDGNGPEAKGAARGASSRTRRSETRGAPRAHFQNHRRWRA